MLARRGLAHAHRLSAAAARASVRGRMVAAADQPDREPDTGTDPSVLAERRARRAELAEGELRARLAEAEQRVAQLEHGAHESTLLRERLAARAERDARMAALVADAAATLRAAREALDREIAARGVAEAALHAERAAREAAEQAVVAERAARDAATSALTAERARLAPVAVERRLSRRRHRRRPPPRARRAARASRGRRGARGAGQRAADRRAGARRRAAAGAGAGRRRAHCGRPPEAAPAARGGAGSAGRGAGGRCARGAGAAARAGRRQAVGAAPGRPRRAPRPRPHAPALSSAAKLRKERERRSRPVRTGAVTSGARDRPGLRPSPRPLRVLAARRRLQDRRARRARRGVRAARAGAHRPRRDERRGRALQGGAEARDQADRRLRDLLRRRPRRAREGGAQPPDAAGLVGRGLPQPRQALLGRLPRGPQPRQADGRHGPARGAPRGRDRPHRLPGGSRFTSRLVEGRDAEARAHADDLLQAFGHENVYFEVQKNGIAEQDRANEGIVRIAREVGRPLVGTGDVHYLRREDYDHHTALLCVQTKSTLATPKMTFDTNEFYLRSSEEMAQAFAEWPEALASTLEIAERCDVEIELGKQLIPRFLPEGEDERAYLRDRVMEGLRERYGDPPPAEAVERMEMELGVIDRMGFNAYFLIVWDFVDVGQGQRHRRRPGPRLAPPARSSPTACGITDVDPLRYDLLFERFLNPERVSMPDIDIDFSVRGRERVMRYVTEKYGRESVAQIVTFGKMFPRAATRDAARVLGHDYGAGDRLAKLIPDPIMGRSPSFEDCLQGRRAAARRLRQRPDGAADRRRRPGARGHRPQLVDPRRRGRHRRPAADRHRARCSSPTPNTTDANGDRVYKVVTQFSMKPVEELGLLKMDFLGLRNLDVIEDALDIIERSTGDAART